MEPNNIIEKPEETMIDHAASLAIGGRPAGGPYEVQVFDGPRGQTPDEYRIRVVLVETIQTEEEDYENVLMDRRVRPRDWRAAIRRALVAMGARADSTRGR